MINGEDFLSALNDIMQSVQSATIPADQTNPFDLVDSIDGFYEICLLGCFYCCLFNREKFYDRGVLFVCPSGDFPTGPFSAP